MIWVSLNTLIETAKNNNIEIVYYEVGKINLNSFNEKSYAVYWFTLNTIDYCYKAL